jgi:hypothetical protein
MMVMVALGVSASSQTVWSAPPLGDATEEPAQTFMCRTLEEY